MPLGANKFQIVVTLNSQNIEPNTVRNFLKNGATIFRINASFLNLNEIAKMTNRLRDIIKEDAKIMIDLPGAKIRFSFLEKNLDVEAGVPFKIKTTFFNHPDFINKIDIGSTLRINDGLITLEVLEKTENEVMLRASDNVVIKKGKGIHLGGFVSYKPERPFTAFDEQIIREASSCGVDYLGLSFVSDSNDVEYVQSKLSGTRIRCIPKIEAKESIRNLYGILRASKKVIVDRGDLAGETGIDNVWKYQRHIISMAHLMNTEVILATQFFTSMINRPLPTLSEIDSLYSLLDYGADGIQLSDETCVGKYAVETIKMLSACVKGFNGNKRFGILENAPILWIMGPTSSGKTTLAESLGKRLVAANFDPVLLDGDEVRNLLGKELGFSEKDRGLVIENLVHHARKHSQNGSYVIVSALTASPDARRFIRKHLENLIVINLKCSIEECIRRDPKGLYARAKKGEIDTLIGFNEPYLDPEPSMVDLSLDTHPYDVDQCTDAIINYLVSNDLLSPGIHNNSDFSGFSN